MNRAFPFTDASIPKNAAHQSAVSLTGPLKTETSVSHVSISAAQAAQPAVSLLDQTPSAAVAEPHQASRVAAVRPVPASPQLQMLRDLFPSFEPVLLQRLLLLHNHDAPAAIEALLEQSDQEAYMQTVLKAEEEAQAKAAEKTRVSRAALEAANARVVAQFHERDPDAKVSNPDIIRMQGRGGAQYVKIRARKGRSQSKRALKAERKMSGSLA